MKLDFVIMIMIKLWLDIEIWIEWIWYKKKKNNDTLIRASLFGIVIMETVHFWQLEKCQIETEITTTKQPTEEHNS